MLFSDSIHWWWWCWCCFRKADWWYILHWWLSHFINSILTLQWCLLHFYCWPLNPSHWWGYSILLFYSDDIILEKYGILMYLFIILFDDILIIIYSGIYLMVFFSDDLCSIFVIVGDLFDDSFVLLHWWPDYIEKSDPFPILYWPLIFCDTLIHCLFWWRRYSMMVFCWYSDVFSVVTFFISDHCSWKYLLLLISYYPFDTVIFYSIPVFPFYRQHSHRYYIIPFVHFIRYSLLTLLFILTLPYRLTYIDTWYIYRWLWYQYGSADAIYIPLFCSWYCTLPVVTTVDTLHLTMTIPATDTWLLPFVVVHCGRVYCSAICSTVDTLLHCISSFHFLPICSSVLHSFVVTIHRLMPEHLPCLHLFYHSVHIVGICLYCYVPSFMSYLPPCIYSAFVDDGTICWLCHLFWWYYIYSAILMLFCRYCSDGAFYLLTLLHLYDDYSTWNCCYCYILMMTCSVLTGGTFLYSHSA